ncbi:histone-lysine N-methyltransferase [Medicago truncatula]|uniref:Histone-lysine N-methyltransferase n=1 Tax=Medicago truncatula TaxID=3880 RepID=A0A072UZ90_MEDTR|nr:histone-lysine N-methyltransferase [Medicago truncatula]
MEELQQALKNCNLTVSTISEKGRSLFTTRDFHPGDVIISQEPYVCVPTQKRCDGCFSTTNLSKCSRCQVVWYCGTPCQKSEWKLHRLECQALSRLDSNKRKSVTPSIRLMLKLYLRRKLQDQKIIPSTAMDNYKLVEALVAHMSDIKEEQLVLYAQMANLVHLILQWPEINIKEIANFFSKFACNAHTVCDSELRPLGTGLYPVVSIINHSCLPNSVLVFDGREASVRALQHIPKGTEGQYEDVRENAILEGYRCKNETCDGFLLRTTDGKAFQCQECGLVRDKEEIKQIATEIKFLLEEASKPSSNGNSHEAISIHKMIEKLQTKLYHPFSINLMQTRETILKSLMKLEYWREALAYCKLTIPIYQRVYPAVHPLLGLQYYTCGKLEWYLGDTEEAIKSLTKAVDILRITHGTKTPFVKELSMMLVEARAEASFLQIDL